jgi:multidrug efflux pump subunit AcrA (membrane-fusion protein)
MSWRSFGRGVLFTIGLRLCPVPAGSQPPPAPPLSLDEYLRMALTGHPLLEASSRRVEAARGPAAEARAALDLARRTYARGKQLYEHGVGAQKTFLTTEGELKVAEATRLAAERRLHGFGMSDEEIRALASDHGSPVELTLTAPIDGQAVDCGAVLGAMVDASRGILTIVDTRSLWADGEIFERDIARVRLGQNVAVRVPAFPEELFEGTVTYVGDAVKRETRTIAVRTEVPNPDQRLKRGMFANLVFRLGKRPLVVAVPAQAILDDTDGPMVFVRTAAGCEARGVELGAQDNGNREIVHGVSAGDVVVTSGHYQLKSRLREESLKGGHAH